MAPPDKVQLIANHILKHLSRHRAAFASQPHTLPTSPPVAARSSTPSHPPPLFVAVQGPQGSGKSFLSSLVSSYLSAPPHALNVAVLSLDDLYLPHPAVRALEEDSEGRENKLLRGRGMPGTHDVPLGSEVLEALRRINENGGEAVGEAGDDAVREVLLPAYDKSAHSGAGDRAPREEWGRAKAPLDVLLFEGWCVGFCPVSAEEVGQRWEAEIERKRVASSREGLEGKDSASFRLSDYRKEDILQVNEKLRAYLEWWEQFSVFVQVRIALFGLSLSH